MFKLSERREANHGVYCGEEGLYLGGVALVERDGNGYRARSTTEIASLLAVAFDSAPDLERCLAGINQVTRSLGAY